MQRICGQSLIDVEMLKRHTEYNLISADAPVIGYFWSVMASLTQEELKKFCRFAYGSERLPSADEAWTAIGLRMMIKPYMRTGASPDQVFPKADTCFFNLELPNYSSKGTDSIAVYLPSSRRDYVQR